MYYRPVMGFGAGFGLRAGGCWNRLGPARHGIAGADRLARALGALANGGNDRRTAEAIDGGNRRRGLQHLVDGRNSTEV